MDLDDLFAELYQVRQSIESFNYDREKDHYRADEIIIKALRLAGRDSGCDTYLKIADLWEECRSEGFYYI